MHKPPVTPAVRVLRAAGVSFAHHPYLYQAGGTGEFARQAGVDEHLVIKTLVMEDERREALIMLMHGDRAVATGCLARALGVKRVVSCDPAVAERHTGYRVGGTSPFGIRRPLPIYAQRDLAGLEQIYINGGKRGYIIALAVRDLERVLQPTWVDAMQ